MRFENHLLETACMMAPRGFKRIEACVRLTAEAGAMGGEVRGTEAGGKGTVQLNGAARGWNITIWGNGR